MEVLPMKEELKRISDNIKHTLYEWAQSDYPENTDSMDFIVLCFVTDLMHYCHTEKFNFQEILTESEKFYQDDLKALAYQVHREEYYQMFQVGDTIESERSNGVKHTATILEIEFRNSTYICKVKRADSGEEDVWAWHIYQDNISVRKIQPEMVTMTKAEFDRALAEKYQEGYAACNSANGQEWRNHL